MPAPLPKHAVMTLYSHVQDLDSHRVRFVLSEKGILYPDTGRCMIDMVSITGMHDIPEDLRDLNPYGTLPTLVERDLVLYDVRTMIDYLDERFPHPPLLPVYPVARARTRLMIYRIEKDWRELFDKIQNASAAQAKHARTQLRDSITALNPVFGEMPYFLSEELSMTDCFLVPLLWRLSSVGVELPDKAKAVHDYMDRLFSRLSFRDSLTEEERDMRDLTVEEEF